MYIVRRPFKSLGTQYVPGDVLTGEEDIKFFKSKLTERKILRIPTSEEGRKNLINYFNIKYGVKTDLNGKKESAIVNPSRGSNTAKPTPNTHTGTPGEATKTAAEILAEIKNKK